MTHIPAMANVESSNIQSIGYDGEQKALHVRFKSGGHYLYAGVPEEIHKGLIDAPSKTRYLRATVIGKHPHTKVDADAG